MYSNKCSGTSIVLYRPRDRGINRSNKPGWKIETSIRIATLFVSGERGGIRRRLMMQSATKRGEKGEARRGGGSFPTRFLADEEVASSTTQRESSSPLHQRILYPLSRTRYTRRSASVNRRCWNSPEIPPSSWFRSGFLAEWTKKAWKKNGACVFWESKRRRQSFECDEIFDFCTRQGNISWSLNESVDENVAQYKRRVSKSRCILSLETISKLI